MAKVELKYGLKPDGEFWMDMLVDGDPKAHILLDASELSALLLGLAKTRSQMPEQVTPRLDPGSRLEAIADPAWYTEPNDHGRTLALRHPGFGWLGFVLPAHEAKALGEHLVQSDGPQMPSTPPKP